MAVKPASKLASSVNYDSVQNASPGNSASFYGQWHYQPDPWRPTGKGLNVSNPGLVATEFNANACLINRGTAPGEDTAKIYLYVDTAETAWTVSGEYGQAHDARTWYPRNLKQDDLVLTGYVPNQTEYDRLVRFVQRHHYTALHGADYNNNWFHFVDFLLFQPFNSHTFNYFPITDTTTSLQQQDFSQKLAKHAGLNYGVVIVDIDAGHERFQFAPGFTLTCKVTDDRRSSSANAVAALYQTNARSIDYTQIFGSFSSADPVTAGTTSDPSLSNTQSDHNH